MTTNNNVSNDIKQQYDLPTYLLHKLHENINIGWVRRYFVMYEWDRPITFQYLPPESEGWGR